MTENHIIFSYLFNGKGGSKPLYGDEITKKIESKELAWVHMDAAHPDTKNWLNEHLNYLDPFVVQALIANETRPRMTQIGNGMIIILRGVNMNEGEDPEDMVSIRMWIDPHRIISIRKRKMRAVLDIENALKYGNGPKNSGEFICNLISNLFHRTSPILNMLDDKTDSIEEAILEDKQEDLREEIVLVRKRAIMFRRYMAPQRDAISNLKMCNLGWITEENRRFLQEAYNQLSIYIEDLDAIRERAQIVKDEIANIIATQLNKNTYILSVIAAIFLPLGFLTGLLGTNFNPIPGADFPNSFWIFCFMLIIIVAIQVLWFKKQKWF